MRCPNAVISVFVLAALSTTVSATGALVVDVNPQSLKPCFERYDGYKLIDAMPFHSEHRMTEEELCLPFCASTISRCSSIVYDKFAQVCHYFMERGIESELLISHYQYTYFQVASRKCADDALAKTSARTSPHSSFSADSASAVEAVGANSVPFMFAPENFPQPPSNPAAIRTVAPITPPTDVADVSEPPFSKPQKFDSKVRKTEKSALGNDIDDIRVPAETEALGESGEAAADAELATLGGMSAEELLTSSPDPGEEYDDEMTLPQATTTPPATTEEIVETDAPATTPDTTTSSHDVDEVQRLREEIQKLKSQVGKSSEPAESDSSPQYFSPKFAKLPAFPAMPTAIMENANVEAMLPKMKGFSAVKKPLPASSVLDVDLEEDPKAMTDIRRAPAREPQDSSMRSLAQALVKEVNAGADNPEDPACQDNSNIVWIAVENSDLPRIGKFTERRASKPNECASLCKKLSIDGNRCNNFVFYETAKKCAFGYEERMFGVKPVPSNDFTTRAFKKLCYPETLSPFAECQDFLSFRDYKLHSEPREVFDDLPAGREGVSVCVELCVLSSAFRCRSATFDFSNGRCALFSEHSLSRPQDFREHNSDSLLYFENGCLDQSFQDDSNKPSVVNPSTSRIERVGRSEPTRLDYRHLS